jgi:hypothetical protein
MQILENYVGHQCCFLPVVAACCMSYTAQKNISIQSFSKSDAKVPTFFKQILLQNSNRKLAFKGVTDVCPECNENTSNTPLPLLTQLKFSNKLKYVINMKEI